MLGNIEESVKGGHDFAGKARAMQSPQMVTRARRFAHELLKHYKDVQVGQDFHEEVTYQEGESDHL